ERSPPKGADRIAARRCTRRARRAARRRPTGKDAFGDYTGRGSPRDEGLVVLLLTSRNEASLSPVHAELTGEPNATCDTRFVGGCGRARRGRGARAPRVRNRVFRGSSGLAPGQGHEGRADQPALV